MGNISQGYTINASLHQLIHYKSTQIQVMVLAIQFLVISVDPIQL